MSDLGFDTLLVPPPVIVLDEFTHTYTVDGVGKRSWSQISRDAGLAEDLSGVPVHHLANARARGSQIDDACALFMEGKWTQEHWALLSDESRPYVKAFIDCASDHIFPRSLSRISVQTPLYCRKLDFCCTPDFHEPLIVNDVKTAKKPARQWGLQTAAQQLAHGDAMVRRIIWLRPHLKTRQYEIHTDRDMDPRIFSKWDYQVVEDACLGNYDSEAIRAWKEAG